MTNNEKKYLTIAVVAIVVIVADKYFNVSNHIVSKLHGTSTTTATNIRAVH